MGDKVEARGREAEKKGHTLTAAACLMRAAHYYQTGERFLQHGPRCARDLQEGGEVVRRRRGDARSGRASNRSKCLTATRRCRRCSCIPRRRSAGSKPGPALVFFDGFDITKEIQYFKGVPDLVARGIACLIVDGPGNGESVRFRDLPLIAETEKYGTAAYEYLAGAQGGRSQAHRRDGDQPRRLLRAARGVARAALRRLHRLGRAVGLLRHLEAALRSAGLRQGAVAVGAAGASDVGVRREDAATRR